MPSPTPQMKHHQECLLNFYSERAMPVPCLEDKETKLMPMTAAKVSLLLVQRRWWNLYYHSPKDAAFLFGKVENDTGGTHRGRINRFPATGTQGLPHGCPSPLAHLLPSTVSSGSRSWAGKSKPTEASTPTSPFLPQTIVWMSHTNPCLSQVGPFLLS